jgi:CxxC-x17-CxxC domain-containing protein
MEPEFMPTLTQEDLVNLPKFQIYLKLMIDGVTSNAFSASTLAPYEPPADAQENLAKVIKVSRERYAKPREVIEDKIIRWAENTGDDAQPKVSAFPTPRGDSMRRDKAPISSRESTLSDTSRSKKESVNLYDAVCSNCGKQTTTKFKPDPKRPVYCPECLQKVKSGQLQPTPTIDTPIPKEVSLAEAIFSHQHKNTQKQEFHGSLDQPAGSNSATHVMRPNEVITLADSKKV